MCVLVFSLAKDYLKLCINIYILYIYAFLILTRAVLDLTWNKTLTGRPIAIGFFFCMSIVLAVIGSLVGWLAGWLVVWLTGCLVGWLVDWFVGWFACLILTLPHSEVLYIYICAQEGC